MNQNPLENKNDNNREIADIESEIHIILNQVSLMGANDFEIPQIRRILERFGTPGFTLKEAKEAHAEALAILGSKQDYH